VLPVHTDPALFVHGKANARVEASILVAVVKRSAAIRRDGAVAAVIQTQGTQLECGGSMSKFIDGMRVESNARDAGDCQ
jgi:hypothetical protein